MEKRKIGELNAEYGKEENMERWRRIHRGEDSGKARNGWNESITGERERKKTWWCSGRTGREGAEVKRRGEKRRKLKEYG